MLISPQSIQFKIALAIVLTFPYLALAVYAREWKLWTEKLFQSVAAVLLFILSFVLASLLIADYWWLKHWSFMKLLLDSMLIVLLFFPGLALVIFVGLVSTVFKLEFPYNFLLGLLAHLLFLVNMVVAIPNT
jgi:hypothetical protein